MRRRRHRVKVDSASGGDFSSTSIFVTPMLDMAFQILAFFVFTYNPVALEGQFPISLVQGETAGEEQNKKEDKTSPDQPTELKSTLTIEVLARERGRIGSIRVGTVRIEPASEEADRTEGFIKSLNKELLTLKDQNPTEDRISIKASPTLRWEEMMRVIDSARRSVDPKTQARRDLFPRISLGELD